MFIDPLRGALALRQEGHVDTGGEALSRLVKEAISTFQVHASRTEHGPPDGGRERLLLPAINMALLAEGKKCKLQPLRNSHVRKLQVPVLITLWHHYREPADQRESAVRMIQSASCAWPVM
jgi:hypothetical protein